MAGNKIWRMKTKLKHLDRAIAIFGGLTPAVGILGVKRYQTIQQWRLNGVPAEWCPIIEEKTAGAVKCEQLRPDVRWGVLREAA